MIGIKSFVAGLLLVSAAYCSTQSAGVKGHLLCKGQAAPNVTVMLYEDELFKDELLMKMNTDKDGYFSVSGSKDEYSYIEIDVYFYHRCDFNGKDNCYRVVKIRVPKEYITDNNKTPANFYNLYSFELSSKHENEDEHCGDLP